MEYFRLESGDILTLDDNREKAEKLKAAFYRRENLRMINEKVKEYSETLKAYAQENGVVINCGKNRCIDCRRCYKLNKTPIYIAELLK